MQQIDVLVLGAGAAGLMCAIEAGKRNRRVVVVDHADQVGKKILISGGGRCNFTNLHTTANNFLCNNPNFPHSTLSRFTPEDMVAMVERHGIAYHEKTLGQLFCDRSARDIVQMLERECREAGVRMQLGTAVRTVLQEGGAFAVETALGTMRAQSVVVATGGLSIPKMGSSGLGYEIARGFDLGVVEPRPGLVPLRFGAAEREVWGELSGISAEAVVTLGEMTKLPEKKRTRQEPMFREKVLLTHQGLSGPAILQISSYWKQGGQICLDLAPGQEVFRAMLEPDAGRDSVVARELTRGVLRERWAERWIELACRGRARGEPLSNAQIAELERQMHSWVVSPVGSEGFSKAEVTVGGVDTRELNPKTLESRKVLGLYFIGEVVDVTGWLGGYNFQWAWASGVAAGSVC